MKFIFAVLRKGLLTLGGISHVAGSAGRGVGQRRAGEGRRKRVGSGNNSDLSRGQGHEFGQICVVAQVELHVVKP
ncbi:MAG TPA: hypothetical protein VGV57_01860 [Thermoleophilaceae bacterium]|nr:hypothetical protein [Thermoleophilaceae bacterium]